MRKSKKEKEEKSFINVIFTILLVIVLIFILIYVFSKEYRYSVNKDLSQIFKVDMNEKTKFLDNMFKDKEVIKEKVFEEKDKNVNKETEAIKESKENIKAEKETTEKVKEKKEIVKEKTPEEKALEFVNEKYNKSGAFMSYIMNKNSENEYLVGLSDPNTTNLKAAYIVNIKDGSVKEMK